MIMMLLLFVLQQVDFLQCENLGSQVVVEDGNELGR